MADLYDNCLFCKIIKGEIPSYKVFEDDDVYAFLDISQVTRGHVLMVPKKHIENLLHYSEEDAARYLRYIPTIAKAIAKSNPEIKGMNITTNNGKIAGQAVMHSHVHFIPRYSENGDLIKVRHIHNSDKYDEKAYQKVADEIKAAF